MAICKVCHNDDARPLQILQNGKRYIFDCFECAIHQLAPVCEYCDSIMIGHGVEMKGHYYCCAHCVRQSGIQGIRNHIDLKKEY